MEECELILASASPRRKELLEQIWISAEICPASIDETQLEGESPSDMVLRLAIGKAKHVGDQYPDALVIGADTIVISPEGEVMGKPADDGAACSMLECLQGRTHHVSTAFALYSKNREINYQEIVTTEVSMVKLTPEEIESYVTTEEPKGKAGSYAIQGAAGAFVRSISGSSTNVIGLPMAELCDALMKFGAIESRI